MLGQKTENSIACVCALRICICMCVGMCLYVFLCVRKSFCVLAANWLALQMCAALWAYSNKLECLDLIQLTSLAHTRTSRRGSIPMSKEDLQLAQLGKSKDA